MDYQIKAISDAFQIKVQDVNVVTDRLYKLHDGKQTYALKKSRLSSEDTGKWQAIYQTLYQLQIQGFIPLYYARNQVPYYASNDTIHYVMPWIEQENHEFPADEYNMVAHELGKLHATTMVSEPLSTHQQTQHFIVYQHKSEIEELDKKMLEYVRFFESKRFMAPHELQICMYYKDIKSIIQKLFLWFDMYVEQARETKQVKNTLCHGNIKPAHYIIKKERLYFLNWESANRQLPTVDLAIYYRHLFHFQDCDIEKISDSYHIYCQYIDLSDYEKTTLALQLLSLTKWTRLMDDAINTTNNKGSIRLSIDIEREYQQLLRGLQFQEIIYQSLMVVQAQSTSGLHEF